MFANSVVVLLLILVAVISWSLSQIRYARKVELMEHDYDIELSKAHMIGFDDGWTAGLEQGVRDESLRRMSASTIDTVFDQEQ